MATTYLQAVNDILAETNEVELSSSNFANAVGIQSFAKKIVNRAYFKICSHKKRWPFLAAASSDTNDPFGGNVSVETSTGDRWYLLKQGSSSVAGDYGSIDWDSFFLTSFGATGASSPYKYQNLTLVKYGEWAYHKRKEELQDANDNQDYGLPRYVMESPDGRHFGLSPIPDDAYKIYFMAWDRPSRLVNHDDVLTIPDEYINVILDLARYYMYNYKERPNQAQWARQDYRNGLNSMVYYLLGEDNQDMVDDRIRYEGGR